MSDIFNFKDYRKFLKAYVENHPNSWGMWGRIAKAAGCQQTYLTQCIREQVHLTEEHVLGISEFIGLNESATEYFLNILGLAKAGTKKLERHYQKKLASLLHERENIAHRINKPRVEVGVRESFYYSSWIWSALHILLSIPEYQTSIQKISKKLMIPELQIQYHLDAMVELGFIEKEDFRYKMKVSDLHVPKESPMLQMHHSNWRQRAMIDSANFQSEGIHFTGVYSVSRNDFNKLKDLLLSLIDQTSSIVAPSPEEELIALTFDLFSV